MAIGSKIGNQLRNINKSLIETSFQIDYNFVSNKSGEIVWSGYKDISSALKNLSYEEIYRECIKERAFNFKLIDGALLQFMYSCKRDSILKHRLAFYPNPDVERFQDNPSDFEEVHFGKELFAEIYEKKALIFPVRFDFDIDEKKYVEHDHCYSHLTLGNYKNCRIPVSKPITPFKFVRFILKSFYFNRYKEFYNEKDFVCDIRLESLLSENEAKQIYLSS
ncbi:DUF2290 domain-containing protein [Aquimarina sp. U1-2]|uniref:DUF2290 domain-containing protein n=1 Tax=Aquimarina sp. U1-2 TaxID=2823141 RepID=UPI001AECA41B|nr:DUF2290 domain-containing protein [Aquimarina sp. U1-2]MBP2833810.1 DUF2290 domain-containing protein [Aquimarina sp. U1-2]